MKNDNDLTLKEVYTMLSELESLMVDKSFVTPSVSISSLQENRVAFWVYSCGGSLLSCGGPHKFIHGNSVTDCYNKTKEEISKVLDPQEAALQRYISDMATVVDKGRADGVPDDYTQPVSLTIKAMSDNLLMAPVTGVPTTDSTDEGEYPF